MGNLECDFETRSDIDLRKHGAFIYFQSPNARVLLGAFKIGGQMHRWRFGEPCPAPLRQAIEAGEMITAHNAGFEILCFQWLHKHAGWPAVPIDRFRCTAATAAAMQLPRALDRLGAALDLKVKKDKEGMRLIRKFSIPQKDGRFIDPADDPVDFGKFCQYCDVDVETEAEADTRLVPLSETEQAVYTLTERINHRGVRIDVTSARIALKIVEQAKHRLDLRMAELTGGVVRKCSEVAKLTRWLESLGVPVESLAKADIEELLDFDDLPAVAREALEVRQEAAKTSTAKLAAMLDRCCRDGRVRGEFMYHAAGTGRTQSAGVNLANLPRPRRIYDEAVQLGGNKTRSPRQDLLFASIREGDADYLKFCYGDELGRPLHLLSDAIRGFLWAGPGNDLIQADYSNIEGSVIAWLAGETWKLEAISAIFADPKIPDLYRQTAAGILGLPLEEVTKKHWARQAVGKPAELACFTAETKVLTSNGVKSIVEVSTADLLWDGVEWVNHQGVISKGARPVVRADGIGLTADHLVLTPHEWASAQQLVSDPNTLALALARGSENLPSSVSTRAPAGAFATSSSDAVVAQSRTSWRSQIFEKARQLAARLAQKRLLAGPVISFTTGTKTSSRTQATEGGCSTGSLPAMVAVSTRKTGATKTTAGAGSPYFGDATAALSWPTLSLWTDGIIPRLSWIGSKTTATTRRVIFGSSPDPRTQKTSAAPAACPTRSLNSGPRSDDCVPVFDILNAGPRHRFTVCSDSGYLIVHNCGFQGGVSAFYTFARNGGVDFSALGGNVLSRSTEEQKAKAEKRFEANFKRNMARARELPRDVWIACEIIKNGWRDQNPAIAQSWHDLEAAAREAVENPGQIAEAARVRYIARFGYLWAQLPSGRCLCYGAPRLKEQVWAEVKLEDGSWSDAEVMDRDAAEKGELRGTVRIKGNTSDKVTAMTVNSQTKQWTRIALYGGLLCENNTQATARDVLVNGMFKAEAAGYPIILTVYDEIIAEVPRGFGDLRAFEKLICELPAWADGLPIAAGGWRGKRYRKE